MTNHRGHRSMATKNGRRGLFGGLRLEPLEGRCAPYSLTAPWATDSLTYSFVGAVTEGRALAVQQALQQWASVSPLTFTEVPDSGPLPQVGQDYPSAGAPDLRFTFGAELGVGTDGSIQGLAYLPPASSGLGGLAGDVFLVGGSDLNLLKQTALHEVGHALGLEHSSDPLSVMYPVADGRAGVTLSADDVAGIRALYGSGQGSVSSLDHSAPQPPPNGFLPTDPYPGFHGFVDSVASDDLTGDGVPDPVTLAQGSQGHLKVFDGDTKGQAIFSQLLYPGFLGGVSIAAGGGHFASVSEGAGGHLIVGTPSGLTASLISFPGYGGSVGLAAYPDHVTVTADAGHGATHQEDYAPDGTLLRSEVVT